MNTIVVLILCCVADIPSAEEMRAVAEQRRIAAFQERKITFRQAAIDLIRERATRGFDEAWIDYLPEKEVYTDLVEELKKAGYEVKIGQRMCIRWGLKEQKIDLKKILPEPTPAFTPRQK